jgi:uncharacterized protein YxjI
VDVTIQERHFSLRSEYDITAPEDPKITYFAQKALLSLLAKLELRTLSGEIVATIHGNFSILADYDIDLADGRHFHYGCEKFFKDVYSCVGDATTYHLFEHRGVRYSIFQDNTQVAAITRNRMVIGAGHEYDIRMNRDADVLVIVCMILALNTNASDDDNNNSTITYDFGKIGPEDRAFDENWQPS